MDDEQYAEYEAKYLVPSTDELSGTKDVPVAVPVQAQEEKIPVDAPILQTEPDTLGSDMNTKSTHEISPELKALKLKNKQTMMASLYLMMLDLG